MDTKNCRVAVQEIISNLRHLPELLETIQAIEDDQMSVITFGTVFSEYSIKWCTEYFHLIEDVGILQISDYNFIRLANKQCQLLTINHGAARGGADYFLKMFGAERQKQLPAVIMQGINSKSPIFTEALKDLSDRMMEGHRLAVNGIQLGDGVSKSADYAIWGFTKGLRPIPMVHFVLCHFFERVFSVQYARDADRKIREMVKQKDTLLSAMSDVMLLRYVQQKGNPDMMDLWTISRKDGGLEWISRNQINVYKQTVK